MRRTLKLSTLAAIYLMITGCYGKYIHEDAQDRQKDAGIQNFSQLPLTPELELLQPVACVRQLPELAPALRRALIFYGEPQTKVSSQIECYQQQATNQTLLKIKPKDSDAWIWLAQQPRGRHSVH